MTKRTTLLVVGDQEVQRLVGHDKCSKHRKAEALIADGHAIRILRETDFRQLAQWALPFTYVIPYVQEPAESTSWGLGGT